MLLFTSIHTLNTNCYPVRVVWADPDFFTDHNGWKLMIPQISVHFNGQMTRHSLSYICMPRICPGRALRQEGKGPYILNAETVACQRRFNDSHCPKQPQLIGSRLGKHPLIPLENHSQPSWMNKAIRMQNILFCNAFPKSQSPCSNTGASLNLNILLTWIKEWPEKTWIRKTGLFLPILPYFFL